MRILAIVGSPRPNGNTFKSIQQIEKILVEKNNQIEFVYEQLSKVKLETCKGCYQCIEKGEDKCPLKDERENLEFKMKQADAVIFATPVYTYNVSWIMKNFLDRFAYRCHRPEFHGKKAMMVITTGAVGLGFVGQLLSQMIGAMGFVTCAKVKSTFAPTHEIDENKITKETRKLEKQVEKFYHRLMDTRPIKPSFSKLLIFKMQQKAFSKAPQNLADYKFWKEKGWLDQKEIFYYKVRVGIVKRAMVSVVAKLVALFA